ncbi:MAG: ABC transporter ATP-binding protein [Alphaproteobacteria bacterium]|nr:ABC transporter ATP-binding protein [Alphaproteobacteria bacterium]
MGAARRAAFADLFALLRLTPKPRRATATLIVLGLASSLAETLGITLILLFFYSAMGQLDVAASTGGLLGDALAWAGKLFESSAQMALFILLLIVARGALAYAYGLISESVSSRISERAMNLIHKQYLSVAYGFVQKFEQAQLMEVLGTESWTIAGAHASFTRIIVSLSSIAVFTAFLLALSWQVALIAVVGSALTMAVSRRLSEPARKLGAQVKEVNQELAEHMLMTLQGMRTIRAYAVEDEHQQRFMASAATARENRMELARQSAMIHPITEVSYLAILCAIIAGAPALGASFATTVAAIALLYRLQPHVRSLEGNLLYLAQVEPQLRSVRAMLDTGDKEYPLPGHRALASLGGGIRFENVTFRYRPEGKPVLDDVSFEIPEGVTTALVGSSGAGKTTVVNLLLRLYRPQEGRILVGEAGLDEISRRDWLGHLAVAGQDVELIEGTVIDNIRMARHDASEADIIDAARIAGVAEFIEPLPDGYETWIGQEGLNFSGGQRQRIGLARAVLRDPRFLILDEAMSALDRGLEDRIRQALDQRFRGRTILLITHRLETVLNADKVVCIEEGRVVSAGPPDALLSDPTSALTRALQVAKQR